MVLLLAVEAASALEWEPVVEPYDQIFPALELATATMRSEPSDDATVLGDPDSLIGAQITAERDHQQVRLEVEAPRLMRTSIFEGELPRRGQTYTVYPSIAWNFEALAAFRQPAPEVLEMRLTVDGKALTRKLAKVRIRSVNDALYWVGDAEEGSALDFNWLFAAYVNEDHPLVDRILKEALETGIVESFSGYQDEDPDAVYRQVFAIWYVLQRHGIRYSSITRTSSASDNVLSQYVRFIDQSWENTQANCVDGTVLFASVMRKIELDPLLVMVPEHAFLGFALDAEGREFAYLETTLLGARAEKGQGSLAHITAQLPRAARIRASFRNFEAAVENATAQVDEAGQKFNDEAQVDYQMVDIQQSRELGVMPIVPR